MWGHVLKSSSKFKHDQLHVLIKRLKENVYINLCWHIKCPQSLTYTHTHTHSHSLVQKCMGLTLFRCEMSWQVLLWFTKPVFHHTKVTFFTSAQVKRNDCDKSVDVNLEWLIMKFPSDPTRHGICCICQKTAAVKVLLCHRTKMSGWTEETFYSMNCFCYVCMCKDY